MYKGKLRKRAIQETRRRDSRRKQIHQLLDLTLDINGLEARRADRTGNLPTAFFWLSGHIADINISVYRNGYKDRQSPDDWFDVHFGSSKELKEAIKHMEEIKSHV